MNVKAYIEKFMTERKDFQKYFLERLVDDDGYVKRSQRKYDAYRAMDVEMLIKFLEDTQPGKMATLAKKFGRERDEAIATKAKNRSDLFFGNELPRDCCGVTGFSRVRDG